MNAIGTPAGTCRRSIEQAERLCRDRGVRLTPQRRQVLEILLDRARPMGAYEILDALGEQLPGARPPTVYRALEFLLEQGLVHRLESLNAFVGCLHPDHPHASQFLICRDCGQVQELENAGVERSLEKAIGDRGFAEESRVIEVTGRCARCLGRSG